MVNQKISELNALTFAATNDELVLVDTNVGETKKITFVELTGSFAGSLSWQVGSAGVLLNTVHRGLTNEHLDWTVDLGVTNINAGNYTDTDTTTHSSFSELDYVSANHTGFAEALGADDNYVTDTEKTNIGNLNTAAYTPVGDYAGSPDVVTISGAGYANSLQIVKNIGSIVVNRTAIALNTGHTGSIAEHLKWENSVGTIHSNNYTDTGDTTAHASFSQLDYASAGHTGFAAALGGNDNYVTDTEKTNIGNLDTAAYQPVATFAGSPDMQVVSGAGFAGSLSFQAISGAYVNTSGSWLIGSLSTELGSIAGFVGSFSLQVVSGTGVLNTTHRGSAGGTDHSDVSTNNSKVSYSKSEIKGVINHGGTAGTGRPTGFDSVEWIGTVEPSNAANDDTWIDTT